MIIHLEQALFKDPLPVFRQVSDDACRALGRILGEGADVHRCLAAQALGRIGGEAAIQPLIDALLDEDEDVRTDAAEALARRPDPRARQQLFENLLGDPCAEVKLAAIEALVNLRDPALVPWLRRMVVGRDEEITWDEQEFHASGWDDWVDIQIRSVNALAEMGVGEAVPEIIAAMADENAQDMSETAFKAFARLGGPGIEALARMLDGTSPRLRRRAAATLAAIRSGDAADHCSRALSDGDPSVRLAALRGLAAWAPDDPRLEPLFADADETVRAEVIALCAEQHSHRLPAALDDISTNVKIAALEAVARYSDRFDDDALVAATRDGLTGETAAAAARALAALAPDAAVVDLATLLHDGAQPLAARLGALQGLAAIGGDAAVTALIAVLDDEARPIRLEVMPALANLARQDAVWPNRAGAALLEALKGRYQPEEAVEEVAAAPTVEPIAPVRAPELSQTSTLNAILADVPEARETLNLPGDGVALTAMDMERLALAKRLKKGKKRMSLTPNVVRHEDIRRFAARVLGDLAQEDVAQQLALALTDADGEVRQAAAESLACIGSELDPLSRDVAHAIQMVLATADRDLKLPLVRALAACEGGDTAETLRGYLRDEDSFLRSEAIRGLAKLNLFDPKIEGLLGDPDPSVRLCAAETMAAAAGAERVIPILVEFAVAFEGYHGKAAARLLRGLNGDKASRLFLELLGDPSRKRIWAVAIEALGELNEHIG